MSTQRTRTKAAETTRAEPAGTTPVAAPPAVDAALEQIAKAAASSDPCAKIRAWTDALRKVSFETMTPMQKRVAIALDVLAQIRIGRMVAMSGSYVDPGYFKRVVGDYNDVPFDFAKTKKCAVCAIGSAVVAATARAPARMFGALGDEFGDGYTSRERYVDALGPYFPDDVLAEMECAFERWGDDGPAGTWLRGVASAKERLVAVMQNIVAHDGEFCVDAKPMTTLCDSFDWTAPWPADAKKPTKKEEEGDHEPMSTQQQQQKQRPKAPGASDVTDAAAVPTRPAIDDALDKIKSAKEDQARQEGRRRERERCGCW